MGCPILVTVMNRSTVAVAKLMREDDIWRSCSPTVEEQTGALSCSTNGATPQHSDCMQHEQLANQISIVNVPPVILLRVSFKDHNRHPHPSISIMLISFSLEFASGCSNDLRELSVFEV